MHLTLEEWKREYGVRARLRWGVFVLMATLGLGTSSFAAEVGGAASRMEDSSPAAAQAAAPVVVREIDDPATGMRWLLERDPAYPGSPGRLVPASGTRAVPDKNPRAGSLAPRPAQAAVPSAVPSSLKAIIRGGDRLVVEQHTAVIEARLEAVALGPARCGATFQARLKIGGKVVRVVELAPGRAELAPQIGGWHGGWR